MKNLCELISETRGRIAVHFSAVRLLISSLMENVDCDAMKRRLHLQPFETILRLRTHVANQTEIQTAFDWLPYQRCARAFIHVLWNKWFWLCSWVRDLFGKRNGMLFKEIEILVDQKVDNFLRNVLSAHFPASSLLSSSSLTSSLFSFLSPFPLLHS